MIELSFRNLFETSFATFFILFKNTQFKVYYFKI